MDQDQDCVTMGLIGTRREILGEEEDEEIETEKQMSEVGEP